MPAERITETTVDELCRLAKLRLDDASRSRLCRELDALLGHFATLGVLDTDGVEPSPYPLARSLPLRADEPEAPLPADEALRHSADNRSDLFRVPRVVDG